MKTLTQTHSKMHLGSDSVASRERSFPLINAAFHGDAHGAAWSPPYRAELRRFRNLSREFLGKETSRDYAKEITLFAILVAASAWPIASMVRALGQLLK